MKRFSFVFHIFFKLLLIFLLVFVWVRYFIRSLLYSIIISAIITAIIDLVTRLFFNKRKQKQDLKFKEKVDAENIAISFAIDGNYLTFYEKLFQDKQVVKKKEYLLLNNQTALFPFFTLSPITVNDVAKIMKKLTKEKISKVIIPCGEISQDCLTFIKIFDEEILLLDKYETYDKIYKNKNAFPEITRKTKEIKAMTFKSIINQSFNKSKTKSYFISALALIFCSLFVRSTLYYVIFTSILLVFAIFSYINPIFNKKTTKEIF